jgi:UDP-N-acetylglucosamine--N-acetylmuramyl-(pentapeptide) pyrophosphoryl-undecaprenol N-acetylglucosamine transferase
VVDALPALLETFVVAHVCGPGKIPDVQAPGYYLFEYVGDGWGDLLAVADLVVSRAGANTLFELLALRKAALAGFEVPDAAGVLYCELERTARGAVCDD